MADLGRAILRLETRDTNLRRGMNRAQRETSRTTRQMEQRLDGLGRRMERVGAIFARVGPLMGVAGAAGLAQFARSAVAAGDEIAKTAKRVGVGAEALQELRFAAERSGVASAQLDDSISRLNRRLGLFIQDGTGPAAKAFERLGLAQQIQAGQLRGTEDVFDAAIRQLQQIEDQSLQAAIASQLFGEDAGPRMALLVQQGSASIADLRTEARELGIISNETAVEAEGLSDEITNLTQMIRGRAQPAVIDFTASLSNLFNAEMPGWLTTLGDLIADFGAFNLALLKAEAEMIGFDFSTPLSKAQDNLQDLQGELELIDELLRDEAALIERGLDREEQRNELLRDRRSLVRQIAKAQKDIARIEADVPHVDITQGQAPAAAGGGGGDGRDPPDILDEPRLSELADLHREHLAQRMERLRTFMRDRREQEIFDHQIRMETLRLNRENELISQEEHSLRKRELEKEHQERLTAIQDRAIARQNDIFARALKLRENMQAASGAQQFAVMAGFLSDMTRTMASESETMFRIHQGASIAEATISTFTGMARALEWGWPMGPIFAAAIGAMGFAQVASIASQSFSGSGKTVSKPTPHPGPISGSGVGADAGAADEPREPLRVANITLEGENFSRRQVEQLMEQMNDLSDDGFRLNVRTT